MRTTHAIAILALVLAGCFLDDPEPLVSSTDQAQTVKSKVLEQTDCPKDKNDLYPKCPKFTATKDACNRIWMEKADKTDGWKKDKPVCLGLGSHLDQCPDCNRLNISDFDADGCKNRQFLECAQAGLIPNQGTGKVCFVDNVGDIKIYPPITDRNYTGREMCYLGFPKPADVDACRKAGGCTTPFKAPPAPKQPAVKNGCSCTCEVLTDEECDLDACIADVLADPSCDDQPLDIDAGAGSASDVDATPAPTDATPAPATDVAP